LIKPQIQKLIIIIMRISIKTAKILTFTDLDVKAAKKLKMLQQNNNQISLIISFPLKQNNVLIADLAMLPAGNMNKSNAA